MASRIAFKAALQCCGMNGAAAHLIKQYGITDADDLSLLSWKDISDTLKLIRKLPRQPFNEEEQPRPQVVIPATVEVKLHGMHT